MVKYGSKSLFVLVHDFAIFTQGTCSFCIDAFQHDYLVIFHQQFIKL